MQGFIFGRSGGTTNSLPLGSLPCKSVAFARRRRCICAAGFPPADLAGRSGRPKVGVRCPRSRARPARESGWRLRGRRSRCWRWKWLKWKRAPRRRRALAWERGTTPARVPGFPRRRRGPRTGGEGAGMKGRTGRSQAESRSVAAAVVAARPPL